MRTALLLVGIVFASGCVSDAAPSSPLAAAEDACGAMPVEPGFAVSFSGSVATMPAADWTAVQRFLDDVDAWRTCAGQADQPERN
jgi:hypothetical protein